MLKFFFSIIVGVICFFLYVYLSTIFFNWLVLHEYSKILTKFLLLFPVGTTRALIFRSITTINHILFQIIICMPVLYWYQKKFKLNLLQSIILLLLGVVIANLIFISLFNVVTQSSPLSNHIFAKNIFPSYLLNIVQWCFVFLLSFFAINFLEKRKLILNKLNH